MIRKWRYKLCESDRSLSRDLQRTVLERTQSMEKEGQSSVRDNRLPIATLMIVNNNGCTKINCQR